MIVDRRAFFIRAGHSAEEVNQVVKDLYREGPKISRVLCSGYVTPRKNMIIYEFEFADLAALASEWARWESSPSREPFLEKFDPLLESDSQTSEVWEVMP
jgi:hypothetical protein